MRFGVREICNVVFKTTVPNQKIGNKTFTTVGMPVLYFDSLKTSSLEQATTTVYAQGGRGNTRLIAWEGEKTLTFTMEDALISEMGLAVLAGAGLFEANSSKNDTLVVHVTEVVKAEDTTTCYVSQAGSQGQGVKAYALKLDTDGEVTGDPKEVTVNHTPESGSGTHAGKYQVTGTDLEANAMYIIDYYTDKGSHARQIDIVPDSFGGNFYIEADTLFRDTKGADHAAQFVIPNGKVQSNFTFSMASSGDPSTFTFTVDAFPGYVNNDTTKKVLSSIQILDDTTSVTLINDVAGDKEDQVSI